MGLQMQTPSSQAEVLEPHRDDLEMINITNNIGSKFFKQNNRDISHAMNTALTVATITGMLLLY